MSGSFERLKYDPSTYARDLKQSTDPLRWRLDPHRNNQCSPCRPADPHYRASQGVSITHQRSLVDVESDLKRLHIKATNDPAQEYIPHCPNCRNCQSGYPCGGGVLSGCHNCQEQLFHFPVCHVATDYTRITNPTCTMRGTGINRFNPLYLEPQDEVRWLVQGEVGISSRNVFKDNHVPCIPHPLGATALPLGGNLPCDPIHPTCANYTKPLHNYYK